MAGRWADDGDGAAFSGERHLARAAKLPCVTPSSVPDARSLNACFWPTLYHFSQESERAPAEKAH